MKSVLGFTFERMEKLSSQIIIPNFFEEGFQDFFRNVPNRDDRNRAPVLHYGQF